MRQKSRQTVILFLNTLITSFGIKNENENNNKIIGIDIGTGASLIYPILGNSIYKWKFICSEINDKAYENAFKILKENKLEENITLIKQKFKNYIFIGIINREKKYIFTMCNPPYYDYKDEIKIEDKNKDCEYNFDEIYCEKGEIGFFDEYFEESKCYWKNVFIFTILIGKKSNAEIIYEKISENKSIKYVDMKRIKNGNIMRYIIYWSFFNNYNKFIDLILYSHEYNKFKPIISY